MKKLLCIVTLCLACVVQADAQNLKDILSGVAKAVVGDKVTTEASLIGTWTYVAPDCQFKGDDVLTNIGGGAAGMVAAIAAAKEGMEVTVFEKNSLFFFRIN